MSPNPVYFPAQEAGMCIPLLYFGGDQKHSDGCGGKASIGFKYHISVLPVAVRETCIGIITHGACKSVEETDFTRTPAYQIWMR
jgi:hypothetical protein